VCVCKETCNGLSLHLLVSGLVSLQQQVSCPFNNAASTLEVSHFVFLPGIGSFRILMIMLFWVQKIKWCCHGKPLRMINLSQRNYQEKFCKVHKWNFITSWCG
jgi:hypothetical protein